MLPTIEMRMVLPVWFVLAFNASNAAFKVAYVLLAPVEPVTVTFCARLADADNVRTAKEKRIRFISLGDLGAPVLANQDESTSTGLVLTSQKYGE